MMGRRGKEKNDCKERARERVCVRERNKREKEIKEKKRKGKNTKLGIRFEDYLLGL